MPKAKPYPDNEEDKTAVESPWEEEASTTVDQGDVAEKIRSLQQPRSTGTGQLDEPTHDDGKAQSALTPVRDVARLVITQGNDVGHETEIRPGKTYTIGRAIDNDVVLTDISVSRHHFDVRFDEGAWLIADRGSGNGTVVNGSLEDNPFMLANGDVIEIGNTLFRFEHPNGAERSKSRPVDAGEVDDEMSTVAGKLRPEITDPPAPGPGPPPTRPSRPKTLPPPTPLRSTHGSNPLSSSLPNALPASTLPLPQMANRPPLASPVMPTMLADPMVRPLPTTIPGQGPPAPNVPLFQYPQATEIPPHSVHAQMLLIQAQSRRSDASTAHVPPAPYEQLPPQYVPVQLTRRAKLAAGAVLLALIAAASTIAVMKSNQPGGGPEASRRAKPSSAPTVPTNPLANIVPQTPAPNASPKPDISSPIAGTPPDAAVSQAVAVTTPRPEPSAPKTEKQEAAQPPAKADKPPAKVAKTEKAEKTDKADKKKRETHREAPAKTEVAVAATPKNDAKKATPSGDPNEATKARERADSLYRAKKWVEAAQILNVAAGKVPEDDAGSLRRTAELYAKLSHEYASGTAPATPPKDAFVALRGALTDDQTVGGAFEKEISEKLGSVAPRAAASFVAGKTYERARDAVLAAEKFGSADSVSLVKQKLESVAGEIYNEAIKELETSPTSAKDKLRQVKSIVDSKSVWWGKADKALRSGPL